MARRSTTEPAKTAEALRLDEARENGVAWRQWGPYLSERQWGTVREDYSEDGDAWNYFTHDQARSRAYHWGEDGLAGISDDHQTGWTGVIAGLIDISGRTDAETFLKAGREAAFGSTKEPELERPV